MRVIRSTKRAPPAPAPPVEVEPKIEPPEIRGRSAPSDRAAAILILSAVVAPIFWSLIWSRRPVSSISIERAAERIYDLKIDVNLANQMELEHLPGVGPVLAKRIVDDREENGPFQSMLDLQRVKGIGPKSAAKMAPFLAPLPEEAEPSVAARSNGLP